MTREEMVKKFLCPGCVGGPDTKCGKYDPADYGCAGHVMGTTMLLGGIAITWALGMPKGFNRGGRCLMHEYQRYHSRMFIRLFPAGETMPSEYDVFNIPVWCMVEDGFLFVRVCRARIGETCVDVIEGGTPDMVPGAVDMTNRQEEYD